MKAIHPHIENATFLPRVRYI